MNNWFDNFLPNISKTIICGAGGIAIISTAGAMPRVGFLRLDNNNNRVFHNNNNR
jgi:hypothetical protein